MYDSSPGRDTSVVIPALNESKTVFDVVRAAMHFAAEVIVVDSGSTDDTVIRAVSAGARVVYARKPGKHHAIRHGIQAAKGTYIVFLDADLEEVSPRIVDLLARPLAIAGVSLVKAYYRRPFANTAEMGGRLTEICARPLLAATMPSVAKFRQPLAGEYAGRRRDLLMYSLCPGYAVDLGILIDSMAIGRVVEVDLGVKRHKHRSTLELGQAAVQVSSTILRRAKLSLTSSPCSYQQFPAGRVSVFTSIDLDEIASAQEILDCEARLEC